MDKNRFYSGAVDLFKNMGSLATAVSTDNQILIQQLNQSQLLSVYLITNCAMPEGQQGRSIVDLSRQIATVFNNDELRVLCLELDNDLENLAGDGKAARCLSLVEWMRRHGRLPELLLALKKQRPRTAWPNADQIVLPTIVKKDDLVVVVGMIHRRDGDNILQDVANYLNEQGKDANILLLATSGQIPIEGANWQQFPRLFRDAIDDTLSRTGAKTGHFFLAGVGAILFSMGCMWSTIEKCVIYHKQDGYHPVISLPL
ncbi:MAG: SAVED domain-containing protein [Ardenticatenaceae bacterium]|nr:SAVED domain-containing protein [Ardenticatenaceae bacterium]